MNGARYQDSTFATNDDCSVIVRYIGTKRRRGKNYEPPAENQKQNLFACHDKTSTTV